MTEYAWIGQKPCGCKVFARLTTYTGKRITALEDACKGLSVRRVPAHKARLTVCRCRKGGR